MVRVDYLSGNEACIPTLAEWHHNQWGYLNPGSEVKDYIASLRKQLGQRQVPTAFIAMSDDVLVGSASLVTFDMDTRMDLSPWLASVYVAPDHRNRGVGSALVERVVVEALDIGIETLYLFTPDRESFYARMGWSVLERTEYRGESVVIMSIDLSR
jgi:GNAT superfamily N-acetyltransferase